MAIPREEKKSPFDPDITAPEKLKKVRETINLTNIDDSALSIAYFTYKVIRKYSPDIHVVHVDYLDWTWPLTAKEKEKELQFLFKEHYPVWEANILKHQRARVEVVFKFPGLKYLVNGV